MSEKALKIVAAPEAKSKPEQPAEIEAPAKAARPPRKRLRLVLLVVLPALAALIGFGFYLSGGRYVSTDNAYVGAQRVLITPDVSGKIVHVAVIEGQHVNPGDELFTLDAEPYRLAVQQAQAKLAAARSDYDKAKSTLGSLTSLAELAQKNVALKQRDSTLSQLLGKADLPLAQFPEYAQAKAALDDAQRNLDHTVVRAPMSGTATQVDNIQLGRFLAAGSPVLSVIDDHDPWVEANPKETDITYLRVGQKVTISIDSFPDHTFKGTVVAVSPGTGAQFSILPPQNATGNWVKVVQRVPVRIAFDKDEDTHLLRSGMSVVVDIDTGHSRLPSFLAPAAGAK